MDAPEKTQAETDGPLRHDGDVPSVDEALAFLVVPQLLAVASTRYIEGFVEIAIAAVALLCLSLISAGIVYFNIGNWDGVPDSVADRRWAYTLAGGIPVLGPLVWLSLRP